LREFKQPCERLIGEGLKTPQSSSYVSPAGVDRKILQEGIMTFVKRAAFAAIAAVCASLAFAPMANAADAKIGDCVRMANQVSSAIAAAQPGQTTNEARALERAGRAFCAVSMYAQGVARYSKALELLGNN
jgi:hypothetical protein